MCWVPVPSSTPCGVRRPRPGGARAWSSSVMCSSRSLIWRPRLRRASLAAWAGSCRRARSGRSRAAWAARAGSDLAFSYSHSDAGAVMMSAPRLTRTAERPLMAPLRATFSCRMDSTTPAVSFGTVLTSPEGSPSGPLRGLARCRNPATGCISRQRPPCEWREASVEVAEDIRDGCITGRDSSPHAHRRSLAGVNPGSSRFRCKRPHDRSATVTPSWSERSRRVPHVHLAGAVHRPDRDHRPDQGRVGRCRLPDPPRRHPSWVRDPGACRTPSRTAAPH